MGFRFRKTVRFGKFIRLNFSNSGTSLSLGPPGANVNIGRRGIRRTLGIPGTGFSHQTFTRWQGQPKGSSPSEQTSQRNGRSFALLIVFAALAIWMGVRFGQGSSTTGSTPPAVAATTTAAPAQQVQPTNIVLPSPAAPSAPTSAAPLTQEEIREVQTLLKALALDPGPIDGISGPLTVAAIKKYEAANQRTQTGNLDRAVLDALRRESSKAAK